MSITEVSKATVSSELCRHLMNVSEAAAALTNAISGTTDAFDPERKRLQKALDRAVSYLATLHSSSKPRTRRRSPT